jgi:hypothetical protein
MEDRKKQGYFWLTAFSNKPLAFRS